MTEPATSVLLIAAIAGAAAIVLAVVAAALLGHAAEDRDLGRRMRAVIRPTDRPLVVPPGRSLGAMLLRPMHALGEVVRDSALISAKDIGEFQRAMTAAGFDPRRAVPIFIGLKALLIVVLPLAGFGGAMVLDLAGMQAGMLIASATTLAVLGPNWAVASFQRPFQTRLRNGLPDALDLLVVATEAGLGLESAVDRVAREMVGSNRAIALELNILVQELRMMPDRAMALERLADRTQLDDFRRLSVTLTQTMRYGTPLAQALRTLAQEMRSDRMIRLEERALRLPVLLIMPLILFILPALFIALVGPSLIEIGKSFEAAP